MKFKELLPAAAAIAFAGGAVGGCNRATFESCHEVKEGSRPKEGACLAEEYADLDALRKECGGKITTIIAVGNFGDSGATEVPIWKCDD
ncbi:hypothetical protein HZC21_04655 [Candidatus Peregrinibacteria bacterium]|nr:hypothetical protein [Candidatus Peregrinibacteria bacterium]